MAVSDLLVTRDPSILTDGYIYGVHSESVSVSLTSWGAMARSDKSCTNEIKVVCVSYWPTSLVRQLHTHAILK